MSWTKKNVHPGKLISTSQESRSDDPGRWTAEKRRISLGLKQVMHNPWEAFVAEHPVGSVIEAKSATSPNSACSSASTPISTAWCT